MYAKTILISIVLNEMIMILYEKSRIDHAFKNYNFFILEFAFHYISMDQFLDT